MMREMAAVILSGMLVSLALIAPSAQGDVLMLEKIQSDPANSPGGVLRPSRGMRMERVLEKFGEPENRVAAVGEPPISRWVYDRFTVYFENQYAITSVVKP